MIYSFIFSCEVRVFLFWVQFMITGGSLDDSKEALTLAETRGNSFITIPDVFLPIAAL